MQVEFTGLERNHLCKIFDDILEHEQLRPNPIFRKAAKRYKNKFYGEGLVNLKPREIGEVYQLAASSLDVLNRARKSETLPAEAKSEAVNYIVIVAGLVAKLQDAATKSMENLRNAK